MEIRRLAVTCGLLAFASHIHAHSLNELSDRQLFENFSLATCIATFYEKSEVSQDAISAMQGYREYSTLPLDVFFEVSKLLESADISGYGSKRGGTVELAYCIDFSRSVEVDALFLKYNSSVAN